MLWTRLQKGPLAEADPYNWLALKLTGYCCLLTLEEPFR